MADRTLTKNYLRDSTAAVGTSLTARLAWLETKRAEISALVDSGDWEGQSTSQEGSSSQFKRHLTDQHRLAAILAAIERLEIENGTGTGASRPSVLGFRISSITG